MKSIKCSNCNNICSLKAEKCPNCGGPLVIKFKNKPIYLGEIIGCKEGLFNTILY